VEGLITIMIEISDALREIIKKEGEKAHPNECCGVIFGEFAEDKKAVLVNPILNSFGDDEKYHRFLITPEDMLKAELKAREMKLEIIGFYHSHPDCPAKPSDYDRTHALPFYSYVIASVMDGKAADITSWELSEDRKIFNQEDILWR